MTPTPHTEPAHSERPSTAPARSFFGRTPRGTSTLPLALVVGLGLSSALAGLTFVVQGPSEAPYLLPLVLFCATLPISATLGWVLAVDRSTLKGATREAELSIESHWYDRAAVGAFGDILALLGLGAGAFAMIPALHGVSTYLVLLVLATLAMVDVAVRYLIQRYRNR